MKNRVSPGPKNPSLIETPKSLFHTFAAEVARAKDTDVVTVPVTTRRQASTTDSFRLTPPSGPDEICEGWTGLAHFFVSTEVADVVCYLTAVRQRLYPEEPEKWTATAKNFVVLRLPGKGGEEVPKTAEDLLPPSPGKSEELPEPSRIVRPLGPRDLEASLVASLGLGLATC